MFWKNYAIFLPKLFVLFFIFGIVNISADTIKLVTGEFLPLSGEKLSNGGITTEIVVKAFEEVGKEVDISFRPWKRGFLATKYHDYFGTFPYVEDEERKKDFLFSDSFLEPNIYFFGLSGSDIKFEKDEDLRGLNVCLPIGYSKIAIQKFLDKELLKITMKPISDAACFKGLLAGRANLYAINEISGWYVIQKTFGTKKDFRTIGKPLSSLKYYLIVDKKYPDGEKILEQFNEGLKLLKEKGTYDEIINRHLGK